MNSSVNSDYVTGWMRVWF